jgi:hypothetical protein
MIGSMLEGRLSRGWRRWIGRQHIMPGQNPRDAPADAGGFI